MKPSLLLFAFVSLVAGCKEETFSSTGTLRSEPLHSQIVGDDYLLRLRLPPGYETSGRTYPLVVQLDPTYVGLHQFDITTQFISEHAASGDWDEAIVLGIDYPDAREARDRDYLPPDPPREAFDGQNADLFYRALRDEILPAIEGELRVDTTRRTILGHSNGALFASYTALRSRPDEAPLFSTVVSADGGYDGTTLQYLAWHTQAMRALPITWLMTRATYNGAVQKIGFDALTERVEAAAYEGLHFTHVELETDHAGAIRPSYERGLTLALGGVR